ncbi:MAG: hypothetical protein HXY37_06520 [Chloroflexi bacterium]|nr:hypothetical protein [Chloroflexota bacterium]
MADEHQTPGDAPAAPPARTRTPFKALLPHLLTAALAVALSLLVQALLWPRPPIPGPAPTAPLAAPSPSVTVIAPTPVASPAATALPNDSVLRLEILDLEAQDRQIWSALYLLRAASQIDDAVIALQGNDLAEADRTLLTAYRSLEQAYAYSAEREKGPIDTFRLQLSQIRDDLHVRPERIDRRLRQLRQLVLSLVEEGS